MLHNEYSAVLFAEGLSGKLSVLEMAKDSQVSALEEPALFDQSDVQVNSLSERCQHRDKFILPFPNEVTTKRYTHVYSSR